MSEEIITGQRALEISNEVNKWFSEYPKMMQLIGLGHLLPKEVQRKGIQAIQRDYLKSE